MTTALGVTNATLGVLGGMGPLVSAEFLKTIYDLNLGDVEQQSPRCILYSDPSIPDRTEAILNGSGNHVLECLTASLSALRQLGATHLVITCVSMHHFLPRVPRDLRTRVISLLDVVADHVSRSATRHVLLCTRGTRAAQIFERHERWGEIAKRVQRLDAEEQDAIHEMIYRDLKLNRGCERLLGYLDALAAKYAVESFIVGCTELHLVNRHLMRGEIEHPYRFVDPLMNVASSFRGLSGE